MTLTQSAYAQHILRNQHEYGSITDTMTLLKRTDRASMSIPYEQLFIQAYHQHEHLVAEQYMGEQKPLHQLAIDSAYTCTSPQTIWTDQYSPTVRVS